MKMKKKLLCLLLGAILAFPFALGGCGTLVKPANDGKQTIFVSVYNGGTGVAWIENLAAQWNETNDTYSIEIRGEKLDDVVSRVQAGETADSASAYFLVGIESSLKYEGLLEDLSDILEREVDGAGNGTIGDKLGRTAEYKEMWLEAAARFGEGMYMLPYADSLAGWVYDHDTFLEYEWLNYASLADADAAAEDGVKTSPSAKNPTRLEVTEDCEYYDAGDYLLTPGKDGKYNTYDDGQPTNVTEWNSMISKIVRISNKKAFIWTSQNNEYLDQMIFANMFQYAGTDLLEAFAYRDSGDMEVELHNSDGTTEWRKIPIEYGRDFYEMEGIYQAYKFMSDNLLVSANIHDSSTGISTTHTEAQDKFLLGYRGEESNPLTAMLFDGIWWENEARPMFETIAKRDADRGYGKRDYRYMLYPDFENQRGIDGEGHGTVFSCMDSGSIIVPKSNNREKVEAVKDFIAFTLSDENLRYFTKSTGVMRAYSYELTDADRAEMTPFARTVYDIYSDTENIEIIRPMVLNSTSPLTLTGFRTAGNFVSKINGIQYNTAIRALQKGGGLEAAFGGLETYLSDFDWITYVDEARNMGYYL